MRRWVVLAGMLASAAHPAAAETVRVVGIFAAGSREASLLPSIGVLPFEGSEGDAVSSAIESRLARLGEDGTPHAELISPSRRPDGLLDGRTWVSVEDEPYKQTRSRCVKKDKNGDCLEKEKYEVRCLARTVELHADLRLTRQRDGRVVYAAAKSREDRDDGCEGGASVTSVDSTLRSMTESIAKEVRLDLAPHREDYTIRVREERAGLSPADADRFRDAVRLTKRDQPSACAAFVAIGDTAPDHGPTLFNRALCAEAAGRYAEAGDLYTRARVFGPSFSGDISRGLERAASLRAGAEDVRRMTGR